VEEKKRRYPLQLTVVFEWRTFCRQRAPVPHSVDAKIASDSKFKTCLATGGYFNSCVRLGELCSIGEDGIRAGVWQHVAPHPVPV